MMILDSIASAFPPTRLSQLEVWELIERSGALGRVGASAARLLETVLKGDSGIATRCFGFPELERVFSATPDDLARGFEEAAPALAARALEDALARAGVVATDLDALFVCTCTGHLCPGVTSHLAERMGMREDAYLQDLVGLGCGAALPMLRSASCFLAANPGARVACVAVEICSAAFYLDNDPGQLISLCLFGDGASASLWSDRVGDGGSGRWALEGFSTLHMPEEREKIRFVSAGGGYLKNQLARDVPAISARAVGRLWAAGGAGGLRPVMHGGGRDVVSAIERKLGLGPEGLSTGRSVLREQGNMSSPSVLVALERELAKAGGVPCGGASGDGYWLCSFGAGFSAHSARLVGFLPSTRGAVDLGI